MSSVRRPSLRTPRWRIVSKFLNETEERLIKKCAAKTQARPGSLSVSALGRVGFSGARLLLCQFGGKGIPFVVKIDEKRNIQKEHMAIRRVCTYFRDAGMPSREPAYVSGFGALIYWHQGAEMGAQVESSKELREIVFGHDAKDYPDDRLTNVFHEVYKRLRTAQEDQSPREFRFYNEYRPYLRGRECEECLSGILGRNRGTNQFRFLGTRILNPIKFIKKKFFMRKQKGVFCPIHGDLHANNVIIHEDGSVRLIDFAWARLTCPRSVVQS